MVYLKLEGSEQPYSHERTGSLRIIGVKNMVRMMLRN